jgi:D-glycero-alpha-D-manno-heptose-7-phosphate kinase
MIISRTPFRVSFFGGGTDYPAWYRQHGGAVLGTTINKHCYISCRYLPPFFDHKYRVVYSRIENCHGIEEIVHPSVREILRYLDVTEGVEIHHDGDLPARSGIGSSSAFTVGMLHAVFALKGRITSKEELARHAIHIEQDVLKETVGSQDQVLAAYGGLNLIEFLPGDEIRVQPLTLHADRLAELNAHLMLFFTGINRTASTIAGSYAGDMDRREEPLRRLQQMVHHAIGILKDDGDLTGFGELLHDGWRTKRSLSERISNEAVEEIYEQARAAGALGGKLLGAGGGGFMLLFVPPPAQDQVRDRLRNLIHVPFKFETAGSCIVFFDRGEDYSAQAKRRATQSIERFRDATLDV